MPDLCVALSVVAGVRKARLLQPYDWKDAVAHDSLLPVLEPYKIRLVMVFGLAFFQNEHLE